eukprot:scaffold2895_cov651-Pavlova_lutheri.AAC.1
MVRVLSWWCTADVTSLGKLTSVLPRKEGLLRPPPLFLSHRLSLAVGNRSNWSGVAAPVLPKVTSGRPSLLAPGRT